MECFLTAESSNDIPHSLFQSGSTMGIQISLVTGCSTGRRAPKAGSSLMSSWTGWRGSSRSRTWRSGPSTRSDFRPLTELGLDPGASRSTAGPGSQVGPNEIMHVKWDGRRVCRALTCILLMQYHPAVRPMCQPSPPPPAASWCGGGRSHTLIGTGSSWDTRSDRENSPSASRAGFKGVGM